ncbi:glycosyltransferase 61 family protein [Antarcticimicrobium luteum]|uniref:Glycosyltransferase family 61 protein n=1 Tax=Antarcticimicrobium luteum TaxID=2547397 RepID=A0A4R5UYL0_9RHOB|nr:glycosyltransferase 61 family protein [Antarcticimicrobium luteum]TDK44468.1 glycosyltransferase family 61 protein [Antarcticimicrobium luteum]
MTEADSFGPDSQPLPEGGWSEEIVTLKGATVVPPTESSFVQPAGILDSDGRYCPHGALWRKYRPLTTEPPMPQAVGATLPGRWLWGGVLWAHFGHFLVESSARLWALANLDAPVDGILFMPKRPAVGEMVRGFQTDFIGLMAPGLPIRVVAEPVRVEVLVVPGQGFGLGRITAGTRKFRDAIHDRFARDVAPEGPEKIYISRSKLGLGKGGLLGEEQLEERLMAEGYEIFHPQIHDIATQVARYKAAKRVIAADGSALHLFAMVGRPDQPVAMILRRQSGANNLLAQNVARFCGSSPVVISALRTEWVKADQKKSNRLSFGELNHAVLGRALGEAGFVRKGQDWPVLSEAERQAVLSDKGLGGNDAFVESPGFRQQRIRALRQARRAARAEREAAKGGSAG